MKIIDKYLLKSFLTTFTTVFVILFFIFILQTVWLFISELAGKDLDFIMILKFLLFAMPRLVPMVLPLSVLLASIMSFGSLSENYEFAAMKSSGISFQRMIRSNAIFILFLSLISFFFANNVIPYAEYKFVNFRRNIAQVKPAMAIAEGQFCEIGNYTIKVDKKSGEKGNYLSGVTIHKKLDNGEGSTTVIKAEKGELISSETSNILKLVLTNGNYYEDIIPSKYEERVKIPFAKGTFKSDVINIDLSNLNQSNMEKIDLSNNSSMLTINDLRFTLDSLNKNYKKDINSYAENIYLRTGVTNNFYAVPTAIVKKEIKATNFLSYLTKSQQIEAFKIAINNIENTGYSIDSYILEIEGKSKNINSHWVEFYDKFMIAFSCILMFFIGAPLGSIIRKGGLGLPIVFAVSIFIVFHFINTFGKRVAQENGMTAFMGVWMSSFVLTPLAILLTYRAINDIGGMVSFDGVLEPIKKLWVFKKVVLLLSKPTLMDANFSEYIDIVYPKEEIIAFRKTQKLTLVLYIIALVLALLLSQFTTTLLLLLLSTCLVTFLYFTFKCEQYLAAIELKTNQVFEPGMFIVLLTAFPFYFLIYIYNKKVLSELDNLNK